MEQFPGKAIKVNEKQPFHEGSKEYWRGEIPLRFEYIFENGIRLNASQTDEGVAEIGLFRGEERIFDFKSLLLESEKLITPQFRRKNFKSPEEMRAGWRYIKEERAVLVGEWTQVADVITLLHEIAHALQPEHPREKEGSLEEKIRLSSKNERDAWAYALKMMRRFKDEFGIDVYKEGFENLEALKKAIDYCLWNHKRSADIVADDEYDPSANAYVNALFTRTPIWLKKEFYE